MPILLQNLIHFYDELLRGSKPRTLNHSNFPKYVSWLYQQDKIAAKSYWEKVLKGFRGSKPFDICQDKYETKKVNLSTDKQKTHAQRN